MPSEIVDMMYTIGPIPMEDEEFLRVLELAGKRWKKKEGIPSQVTRPLKKTKKIKIIKKIR
jgi:hypothetical protein